MERDNDFDETDFDQVCGGFSVYNSHMPSFQSLMGQHSQFVVALENIMHKIDSTQATIVRNLKG